MQAASKFPHHRSTLAVSRDAFSETLLGYDIGANNSTMKSRKRWRSARPLEKVRQ